MDRICVTVSRNGFYCTNALKNMRLIFRPRVRHGASDRRSAGLVPLLNCPRDIETVNLLTYLPVNALAISIVWVVSSDLDVRPAWRSWRPESCRCTSQRDLARAHGILGYMCIYIRMHEVLCRFYDGHEFKVCPVCLRSDKIKRLLLPQKPVKENRRFSRSPSGKF